MNRRDFFNGTQYHVFGKTQARKLREHEVSDMLRVLENYIGDDVRISVAA